MGVENLIDCIDISDDIIEYIIFHNERFEKQKGVLEKFKKVKR